MTDDRAFEVRALRPDELHSATNLFRGSLHHGPLSAEDWAKRAPHLADARVLGALRDDQLVGTALSFPSELAVPGGATLPMAMVTAVGVRADQTRRGVLTALMREQLAGMAEPVATLRASEAVIYGRFGYGVATRGRSATITRLRAVGHSGAPEAGAVRLLAFKEALAVLPDLYRRIGARRPGWIARPDSWWRMTEGWMDELKFNGVVAVHSGPDGDDAFAFYMVQRDGDTRRMNVEDLVADGPDAWAGLWRFLMSVDLVTEVRVELRPLDEPLELLFADRRAVRTTSVDDETWLRLVDVPTALAARTFGELASDAGSTVIDVRDDFLPANSGRYRIGDGPARRVDEPAELALDVSDLAALYLGDVTPSALAAAGRLTVVKSDALRVGDRLFAVADTPWCGTFF
ncbi:MAG TPA: GNAT family N-acetyltransferase [Pseudonocardiaceae bacterium]|jgi:predicted acetyltransferase|nr:GNAT family N-acetyltransferase [Pseudonocardiaceae bacterium]